MEWVERTSAGRAAMEVIAAAPASTVPEPSDHDVSWLRAFSRLILPTLMKEGAKATGMKPVSPPIRVASSHREFVLMRLAEFSKSKLGGVDAKRLGTEIGVHALSSVAEYWGHLGGIVLNAPNFFAETDGDPAVGESAKRNFPKREAFAFVLVGHEGGHSLLEESKPWVTSYGRELYRLNGRPPVPSHTYKPPTSLDLPISRYLGRAASSPRYARVAQDAFDAQIEGFAEFVARVGSARGVQGDFISGRVLDDYLDRRDAHLLSVHSEYRIGLNLTRQIYDIFGRGGLRDMWHAPIDPQVVEDAGKWSTGLFRHVIDGINNRVNQSLTPHLNRRSPPLGTEVSQGLTARGSPPSGRRP